MKPKKVYLTLNICSPSTPY